MRLLLDHCVPRRLAELFTGHQVATAAGLQWGHLRNGALLTAAAMAGFDALITVDKNLRHEQNLATLPIAVLVIRSVSNDLGELSRLVPSALSALENLQPRSLIEVPM